MSRMRGWLGFALLVGVLARAAAVESSVPKAAPTLPQCLDVILSASYLAEEIVGAGPGFLLVIRNKGPHPIEIPDPVPLSVDWYAENGTGWQWRSSSGQGGSLVDAGRPAGALFAARSQATAFRRIPGRGVYSWAVYAGSTPELRFRPGCEHCAYRGESRYRAVLGYAWKAPANQENGQGMLGCGLRSNPVQMPPLVDSWQAHNSGR